MTAAATLQWGISSAIAGDAPQASKVTVSVDGKAQLVGSVAEAGKVAPADALKVGQVIAKGSVIDGECQFPIVTNVSVDGNGSGHLRLANDRKLCAVVISEVSDVPVESQDSKDEGTSSPGELVRVDKGEKGPTG